MSSPWPSTSIEPLLAYLPALENGLFTELAGGYPVLRAPLAAFYAALYDTGIVISFDSSSWARGHGKDFVGARHRRR